MKVVIAMDSFKGSLTSADAGNAAKEGVLATIPDADVVVRPLADGGEGMTEAIAQGLGGEMVSVKVSNPVGQKTDAVYVILPDAGTAVIEMARAAGLPLLTKEQRDPLQTTTYGVGEMILDAIKKGCHNFLIGIGGSATNDGGMGMLTALGYRFLDKDKKQLPGIGASLGEVKFIDVSAVTAQLSACNFKIACDVDNPLCGKQGATYVFAPQKGLRAEECRNVDAAMANYAEVVERCTGKSCRNIPGAGGAGGMGFAFVSFLGGELLPGADLVMELTGLETYIRDADIFITGEGRLDRQSAMGKAPVRAARLAKKHGCKVYAFAGQVTEDAKTCLAGDIDAMYAISGPGIPAEEAMQKETATQNMKLAVMRYLKEEE